ncbi:MAG: hypothetical protein RLZZ480_870, partial [Candidatus Parcubacteria bacterium]
MHKLNHVAIFYDVLLPFGAEFALVACGSFAAA